MREVKFTTAKGRHHEIQTAEYIPWEFIQRAAAELLSVDKDDAWVMVEEEPLLYQTKFFRSWLVAHGLLDR